MTDLFHTNLARMSQAQPVDRQDAEIMLALTRASKGAKKSSARLLARQRTWQGFDLVQVLSNPQARLRWAK